MKEHKFIICNECGHPRIDHSNCKSILNSGVGTCSLCTCKKYKPKMKDIRFNGIVFFCIYAIGCGFLIIDFLSNMLLEAIILFAIFSCLSILYLITSVRSMVESDLKIRGKIN